MKHVVAVAALLLMSCQSSIPAQYKDFFEKPRSERLEAYKRYSLTEQYDLMQLGNTVVHPPMIELVYSFADNGRIVVPILKERLSEADDDTEIRDIAHVALLLDEKGLYDSSNDAALMDGLQQKNDEYPGTWTDTTMGFLRELERTDTSNTRR
jgi:hypothetical protein